MYHVNDVFGVIGLVSPVELNVYEVCPSDMYLQERQFFPHGYDSTSGTRLMIHIVTKNSTKSETTSSC